MTLAQIITELDNTNDDDFAYDLDELDVAFLDANDNEIEE